VVAQLAPDVPQSQELIRAWRHDYPWLHRAVEQIGPGARTASESWRLLIQDELKTTLDFKIRPDGTAAVWCGMSGYDFHHDPTPKELFEGLAEAYRQERKRLSGSNPWRKTDWATLASPEREKPQPLEDSLTRISATVLLLRVEQLVLIFFAVTLLTLALSTIAILTAS
jgi:hypothetical protein